MPEKDLYSFVLHLYELGSKAGAAAFERYLERASTIFIKRFPDSPRSPRILLEGAMHAELAARRGGPREREFAERAVVMADSTIKHKRGRPYMERAAFYKARVQLELLRDPDAAILTIDSMQWRHPNMAKEAAAIRLEALVLSGRWDDAMKRFTAQAASPDSSLAVAGKYGKGMVLFYRGEFDEAATVLSEVAKEAPWSKWANDALATAVLVRRAEAEDPAVLASFAAAMSADGSGKYGEAADSLAMVAGRFPESVLAPEAFYESALLLERAGRRTESFAMLERIAETYPLSRAAPRAVETLAGFNEEDDPDASIRWYALFLERYGEDPWATRVRSRYMRLRKSMGRGDGRDMRVIRQFIILVVIIAALPSAVLADFLVPMDLAQSNHLKAYGLAWHVLAAGGNVRWLLNYRGGSFLMPETAGLTLEAQARGVRIERVSGSADSGDTPGDRQQQHGGRPPREGAAR